jgi:hypothetical protein
MTPLDALWHLLNFFAPAVGIGVLTAALARLLWRRELAVVGWRALVGWAVGPAALAACVGLAVTGRDGKVWTYAGMVAACALGLWWRGFLRRR